jgi:hypothetical protein
MNQSDQSDQPINQQFVLLNDTCGCSINGIQIPELAGYEVNQAVLASNKIYMLTYSNAASRQALFCYNISTRELNHANIKAGYEDMVRLCVNDKYLIINVCDCKSWHNGMHYVELEGLFKD